MQLNTRNMGCSDFTTACDDEVEYRLAAFVNDRNIWLTNSADRARDVATREGHWSDADYDSPINLYWKEDLEVVALEINLKAITLI